MLLCLAGGVLGLILAEVIVRLTHLAPEVAFFETARFRLSDDPRIGYEPIPGFEYSGGAHSYRGKSNSLGFRDREHEVNKPEGVFRIVVLGDSIAAGLTVERFEDTFPAVLERLLGRAGIPAEVINLGVNGYNTMQEVATLEKSGLQFQPDLVLVAYCLNDSERSDGRLLDNLIAAQSESGARPSPWNRRLSTSALYRALRYRLGSRFEEHGEELRAKYAHLEDNSVMRSLESLAQLGSREGFEVIVTVFPYFLDIVDYDEVYAKLHRYLELHSSRIGVRHLDLLQPLRTCRLESGRVANDTFHPNELGHRCAAEAMARAVGEVYRARHPHDRGQRRGLEPRSGIGYGSSGPDAPVQSSAARRATVPRRDG